MSVCWAHAQNDTWISWREPIKLEHNGQWIDAVTDYEYWRDYVRDRNEGTMPLHRHAAHEYCDRFVLHVIWSDSEVSKFRMNYLHFFYDFPSTTAFQHFLYFDSLPLASGLHHFCSASLNFLLSLQLLSCFRLLAVSPVPIFPHSHPNPNPNEEIRDCVLDRASTWTCRHLTHTHIHIHLSRQYRNMLMSEIFRNAQRNGKQM